MRVRRSEFEALRGVLSEADEPLTAREIVALIEDEEAFDSPHRVATILGRRAEDGEIEVVRTSPYQYRLATQGS